MTSSGTVFPHKRENFILPVLLLKEFVLAFNHKRADWAELALSGYISECPPLTFASMINLIMYDAHQQLTVSGRMVIARHSAYPRPTFKASSHHLPLGYPCNCLFLPNCHMLIRAPNIPANILILCAFTYFLPVFFFLA